MSETVSPSEDPLQGPGGGGNSAETGDFESGADPKEEGQEGERRSDGDDSGGMDVPPTSNDDMQDGSPDSE